MALINKVLLICLAFMISISSFGQTIRGKVIDAETQQPLPFCHIQNSTSNQVSLTNEDGSFQIQVITKEDSLLFSYLGYQTAKIGIREIAKTRIVALKPSSVSVNEMVVTTDEYLYDLVLRVRQKLVKMKLQPAQTYLQLETNLKNNTNPLEMIQGYYNTTFKGVSTETNLS